MSYTRINLINDLIKKHNFENYLEIGVKDGECISQINAKNKDGVDPTPSYYTNHNMTSNEFFDVLDKDMKYDIIFIDGLHLHEQAYIDIINSLEHLNDNGYIICHDMLPTNEKHQARRPIIGEWTGDVWRAFAKLRNERTDLSMLTINTDWGLGVITKGTQELINLPENLDYQYFEANKKDLMNIYTVDEFKTKFGL